MDGLMNPLKNIRKPSGSNARDRRLEPGEYERIHGRLQASGNPYAASAFDLAIETSLRQGTLFSLRWEWIDLSGRVVRFPPAERAAANKGVPPVLPLSTKAVRVLEALRPRNDAGEVVENAEGDVLPTTANAVMCVWKRVLISLGIENLRWHDLRHEAVSALFEKGFHPLEVAAISGHKSMTMLKRYTHLKVEALLERLG